MKLTYDIDADIIYLEDETKGIDRTETFEQLTDTTIIVDFDEKDRVAGLEVLEATQLFNLDAEKIKRLVEKINLGFEEKNQKKRWTHMKKFEDNGWEKLLNRSQTGGVRRI